MSRLVWGATGERFYETGVDRGVLYIDGEAHAWSGLVSVEETPSGGESRAYYLDGIKYQNLSSKEEFEASIEAFYSPPAFDICDGVGTIAPGLFAHQQRRKPFNLSYRTKIGNDLDGPNHGYKIHLVYNALAVPTERSYETTNSDPEVPLLSWDISTKPTRVPGMIPTSHLTIDTTRSSPYSVKVLEEILYGDDSSVPRLPDPEELIILFNDAAPLEVIDIGNGMYTISGEDKAIQMIVEGTYRITSHTVVLNDNDSAQISSSE